LRRKSPARSAGSIPPLARQVGLIAPQVARLAIGGGLIAPQVPGARSADRLIPPLAGPVGLIASQVPRAAALQVV